ncbi:cyclic-di-AMP phosphodiesterase GdpP [Erysipelotrichaceae bacterium]|nr:cyclic-di-AMP phosphodiesterase GdpP [Erysipelotrichaceae bacterium]
MYDKRFNKSGKVLANLLVLGIIVLTSLISFILFVESLKSNNTIIQETHNFFIGKSWVVISIIACSFILMLTMLYVFNIQIEQSVRSRIQKMYDMLSTETIKGLSRMPVGVVNYSEDLRIVWANDFFSEGEKKDFIGNQIDSVFNFLEQTQTKDESIRIAEGVMLGVRIVDVYQDVETNMLYFFDKSAEVLAKRKALEERMVIGYIYVDAPEEIQVIEDSGNLGVSSEIHRKIIVWAQKYNAYVRKYASYRWMIITNKAGLDAMCADKMCIREEVKAQGEFFKMSLTISGGFSFYEEDMGDVVRRSIDAIELGQSRGGDQIVVEVVDGELEIYGGDTHQKRRTSRVMVRSTSINLHRILGEYDNVYISGHQFADFDALGAMFGLYQIVKAQKKRIYFIVDEKKFSKDTFELFTKTWKDHSELDEMLSKIIAPNRFRIEDTPEKSVVIIVDTAAKALLETKRLLDFKDCIVIDHHRKGKDAVIGNVLEYIDPFSSSASEMVTELIQYQPIPIDITDEVATCLLAGIILDTNKFTRNVSSRTFEAASFLRKKGAIQEHVLQIMSTNIEDYIIQANYLELTKNTPESGKMLMIQGVKTRLEIAKCADFLLSFPEVKYTIVMAYISETTIAISARSKGQVNVQKIMEVFGGGGHFNNAAAQIESEKIEEVAASIQRYIEDEKREKDE